MAGQSCPWVCVSHFQTFPRLLFSPGDLWSTERWLEDTGFPDGTLPLDWVSVVEIFFLFSCCLGVVTGGLCAYWGQGWLISNLGISRQTVGTAFLKTAPLSFISLQTSSPTNAGASHRVQPSLWATMAVNSVLCSSVQQISTEVHHHRDYPSQRDEPNRGGPVFMASAFSWVECWCYTVKQENS